MPRSTKSKRKPPRKRKHGAGRPSVYDPIACTVLARKLRGEGKTMEDIANTIGVARSTFDEWRKNYPEFSAALQQGEEDADIRVERALFERAVGYQHPETKLMTVSRGEGMGSVVERHEVTMIYPPDTAAAKFWLTNRRLDRWQERQKVEHSGKLTLEKILGDSWGEPEAKPETPTESAPVTP